MGWNIPYMCLIWGPFVTWYISKLQVLDVNTFHFFFWRRRSSWTFSFTKAPHCLKLHIPSSNAVVIGGSVLNFLQKAYWTVITDSYFTNCSTQNDFFTGIPCSKQLLHFLFCFIGIRTSTWTFTAMWNPNNHFDCKTHFWLENVENFD